MVARIKTIAFQGIEAAPVEVQVSLTSGIPAFTVVGLPDKAVSESRERVRAALTSMGLSLPAKRITVNLAPADLHKEGSHFDLPIALGLLAAMGVVEAETAARYFVLGELSLDGRLLPVSGILPTAITAYGEDSGLICPEACGAEAVWASDELEVIAPSNLVELVNHLTGRQLVNPPRRELPNGQSASFPDLAHVKGQLAGRRALEIAAAGGHNLLMVGPPGSGKSMLAGCLPGILPPMDAREMLESSTIHSVAGLLQGGQLCRHRPFRAPHHSTSVPAVVGGGKTPRPGEISLAHLGVLFLDELPEFPRGVLESLRQPLESGTITVARVNAHLTYPAQFQLVAAMNPCRCGYLGDVNRGCGKAPRCGQEYQTRLSGPLLDRIDLHVEVPAMPASDMLSLKGGEDSRAVSERVDNARRLQAERYLKLSPKEPIRTNHHAGQTLLDQACQMEDAARQTLESALAKLGLSMRGYTRLLRVARTIADLEQSETIRQAHMAEAIAYRNPLSTLS